MYYNFRTPYKVGVDTSSFDKIYARQSNSMWCWATVVQMVLKNYGIDVSQEDLAEETCGVNQYGIPNNCPASFEVITQHLNNCWQTYEQTYCVDAPANYGYPNIHELYNQLQQGKPVIVACRNENSNIGHAVLITGMEGYFFQNKIYATKFITRDPWPSLPNLLRKGRVEENRALPFAKRIQAYWYMDVSVAPEVSWLW